MNVLDVVQASVDRGATSILFCSLCPALGKGSEVAPAVAGRQQCMDTYATWRLWLLVPAGTVCPAQPVCSKAGRNVFAVFPSGSGNWYLVA